MPVFLHITGYIFDIAICKAFETNVSNLYQMCIWMIRHHIRVFAEGMPQTRAES